MNLETWIVVDNGDMFEGTREQFMDCFFSNADDEQIKNWCLKNGHSLKIGEEVIFGYKSKWNMIPGSCEYKGKAYRILNIDMQGGYFTLCDTEAKKGEIQVFEDIDMDECNPII